MLSHPLAKLAVAFLAVATLVSSCSSPDEDSGVEAAGATHLLTLEVTGPGAVTLSQSGRSCQATCTIDVPAGLIVQPRPVNDPGAEFWGWRGACSGSGECSLQVDSDLRLEAVFTEPGAPPPSSEVAPGDDDGDVDGGTPGGNQGDGTNGGEPGGDADSGSDEPAQDDGSAGSNDDPDVGTDSNDDKEQDEGSTGDDQQAGEDTTDDAFTLKLGTDGDTQGTIEVDPGDFDCQGPWTCWHDFPAGSRLTLQATAKTGATFAYWSLDVESGSTEVPCRAGAREAKCEFVLDEDIFIYAVFLTSEQVHRVQVEPRPVMGKVIGPGIECGSGISDCHDFHDGTVTLTAQPGQGFELDTWQGDCTGSSEECHLTMDGERVVSALFRERTASAGEEATLSVFPSTYYTGRVLIEPGSHECSSANWGECNYIFPTGTEVTLQAIPDGGNYFAYWSSDGGPYSPTTDPAVCEGDHHAPVCSFTINWDMDVHATFSGD